MFFLIVSISLRRYIRDFHLVIIRNSKYSGYIKSWLRGSKSRKQQRRRPFFSWLMSVMNFFVTVLSVNTTVRSGISFADNINHRLRRKVDANPCKNAKYWKKYLYQGQTIDKVSSHNNSAFKQNCIRETESKQMPLLLELSMVERSNNWVLDFWLCERKQTPSLRFPIAFK